MATVYDQTKDPYFQGAEAAVNRTSVAVVTSDTVDFVSYPRSVTLLTGGTVSCVPLKSPDTAVVFGALLAGFTIPFRVRRINATGTSATFTASYD